MVTLFLVAFFLHTARVSVSLGGPDLLASMLGPNGSTPTGATSVVAATTPSRYGQPAMLTARDVMGTYAAGTRRPPSARVDGCWLEVAPVAADSVRMQLLCRHPGPGHHLGVMDARRRFDRGTVVYETDQFVGHCRIVATFTRGRAVVTHEGSGAGRDQACGFGAYVDAGGTYERLNARRPPFDLAPIEHAAPRE